ncbi:hypothetical protein SADUNF_Sadunf04G0106900 [Salix dunnii]|uniref:Uncharacterized protein n=1 Tax=Salix dunnii TaxID=1413687 RepID=A0A835KBR7_9ROSI|nr:hypothetical protein SADUNF_Sadunf04G0106900 [Salix dunnii]
MAFMANNCRLSYCKVVEVIAETTAPLTSMDEHLAKITSQHVEPKEPEAAEVPKPVPPKIVETPSSSYQQGHSLLIPSRKIYVFAAAKLCHYITVMVPFYHRLIVLDSYNDLKPPTSPTPTQLSNKKESVSPFEVVSKPAIPDTPPMP